MTEDLGTPCYNPATGELLGHSRLHSVEDVRAAVVAAREVQAHWARTPIATRSQAIRRIRDAITERADELAEIIARDNGKTRIDALIGEVVPSAVAADYYARKASYFLRDKRLSPGTVLMGNKRSIIRRVPYGVIGIISPWNYPFTIPFSEVIMGLVAGNAVLLKTATETQLVGQALASVVESVGLPEGLFTFLNLPGRVAGDAFLESGIDKLFFTGSVGVGKRLMAKAAESLTPVSLELGGNDPMIVLADADLDRAAAGAVWAGMQNCGQSCGGVERIYVEQDAYPDFLEQLGKRVRALRVGQDLDGEVDLGAMTTRSQMDQVTAQVEDAVSQGAEIYAQSPMPRGEGGLFLPATVLTQVDHSMTVMREETFGPVVGVMPVRNADEAVELANDSMLGLTASVWSRNRRAAAAVGRRIESGVITINDHLMSHGLPETPWGGFKESGIGRTHGEIGFDEMTRPQVVVDDILPGVKKNLWWHPHGPDVYSGLRGFLDLLYGRGLGKRLSGLRRVLRIVPRMFRP
jgi:succinate-semialdehyde dehydrogenase/glutarate-semialdehyde dehydrogenase